MKLKSAGSGKWLLRWLLSSMSAFSHGFLSLGGDFTVFCFYYSLSLLKRIVSWDLGALGGGEKVVMVATGARKWEMRVELGLKLWKLEPLGFSWAGLLGLHGLYAVLSWVHGIKNHFHKCLFLKHSKKLLIVCFWLLFDDRKDKYISDINILNWIY